MLLVKRLSQLIKDYYYKTKFYAIFLLKPLDHPKWKIRDYTSSHYHKGKDYHHRFNLLSGRNIIWSLEKKLLKKIIQKIFNKKKFNHLDFAGGTGRIAKFFEKKTLNQTILDSSKKMTSYAKSILPNTRIINKDFNNYEVKKKYDLITAFRFFPNAEPKLRQKAFKFISKSLNKSGYLVFNNHRNFWSIPYFMERITFRSNGFGMTHRETLNLLSKNNLVIDCYYSMGFLTKKESGKLMPWKIISFLENLLLNFLYTTKLGYNVIYVIKKK